jgi:hypothetical protein
MRISLLGTAARGHSATGAPALNGRRPLVLGRVGGTPAHIGLRLDYKSQPASPPSGMRLSSRHSDRSPASTRAELPPRPVNISRMSTDDLLANLSVEQRQELGAALATEDRERRTRVAAARRERAEAEAALAAQIERQQQVEADRLRAEQAARMKAANYHLNRAVAKVNGQPSPKPHPDRFGWAKSAQKTNARLGAVDMPRRRIAVYSR